MTEDKDNSKEAFIRFVMCTSEFVSSDKERAFEYLKEEGYDVNSIISEGLKKIKKLQLQIKAEKTRNEMSGNTDVEEKAKAWVDKLLADVSFSFPDFVRKEKMVLQNRNIQSFSKTDIRTTLIKYFTLKFLEAENNKQQ